MRTLSGKGLRLLTLLLLLFLAVPGHAELIRVTGRVQDAEGEPLIGASVTVKGKPGNGVVTDVNGTYNISLERGATIVVSYIGFESQEAKANKTYIDFALKEVASGLNEVVVTGFASRKKYRWSVRRPPSRWKRSRCPWPT